LPSQASFCNDHGLANIPEKKVSIDNDLENRHQNLTSKKSSESAGMQSESAEDTKRKKSSSAMIRSISTISTKLLSSTLPRLNSSNSLKDQTATPSEKASIVQQEKIKTDDPYGEVAKGLEFCYKKVLLPFEQKSMFHQFHYAKYDDCEFEAKPFVLLIGDFMRYATYVYIYVYK